MSDLGKAELLSIVVPVFNERESLSELYAEIAAVMEKMGAALQLIFVDDGSSDTSWLTISEIASKDPCVQGIRFRRNFGKAAALEAGFRAAKGSIVITLDADLQDDPSEIPRFIEQLRGGYDIVTGWKQQRRDPWHKVAASRIFNRFVSRLTGVHLHDHNCGMKAYKAEVFRDLSLYGEMHRFVPVFAAARGYRVGELVINHRTRKFGRSKYGWKRFVKGALDVVTVRLLTGFGYRPQHLLGSWGVSFLAIALLGLLLLLANLIVRFINPDAGAGPFTQLVILICSSGMALAGVQCLLTGVLAEMIVARKWLANEPYSIAERTND